MSYTRYISVYTGSPEQVAAYLYDHTRVVFQDGRKLILQTRAETPEETEFLARYQTARLQSGLHGALYQETREAAEDHLSEFGS